MIIDKDTIKNRYCYIVMGCLSAALFYVFYGFKILDPGYVDWLLTNGDPGQHYLGWALYRNSPFRINFGLTNTTAYPFSTSVIFTDSIPLMALPCKIIGRFTRTQFQYFGIWGLICIILMGILSCRLLKRYIDNDIVLILSSLLITLSPCMFRRLFWHTSLGAHFLIIIALILIACRRELCDTIRHTVIWWSVLSFLCSFIHLYFLAIDAVLLTAFIFFRIIDLRSSAAGQYDIDNSNVHKNTKLQGTMICICAAVSYILTAALSIWLLGGFSSGMSNGAPGLTYYSFNLNGFINPQGWSSILSDLPLYADGQYEGFAYLGLGMLTAALIALSALIIRCIQKRNHSTGTDSIKAPSSLHVLYFICGLCFFLLIILAASSNEISCGNRLLISYDIPATFLKLWDIFRACGRLIWPAVYIICFSVLIMLNRTTKRTLTIVLLILCIFLQLTDLKDVIKDKHSVYTKTVVYKHRLKDKLIDDIVWNRRLKHIVFLDKDNLTQDELYAFAEFAARKKLTINDFYFARALNQPVNEAALDFFMHPSDDTLYVISDESYEMRYMFDLTYYKYGDLSLGLKSPL